MLKLTDRAVTDSPIPLITRTEARMLGTALHPRTHIRLRRGIYVLREDYLRATPWEQYATRVHAFVRSHPDAVLCLESAGVIYGLPLFGHPRDIHVFDASLRTSQRYGDVCVHTSVDGREVVSEAGVLVTSLLDTVVDLARALSPGLALAVVDSAISPAQGGTVQLADAYELIVRQHNPRARSQARWVCSSADERAESPAESISRAVIEWSGFEQPELQHEFRYDGHHDRVDFLFPRSGTIGEADGWGKYQLDDPSAAAALLTEEKRREDRLRRHGHPFARWELNDAWRVKPLVEALRAAGLRQRHPSQPAMLASLRRRTRDRHA
ncbi:hypothetical protein [Microbacterium suwonense]|uniref:Transcriptional regulator, AbiEi antitoxin, Type IV TA system n=1 Tax=Microbacterium suwonense TaxID=683047 RepID=A0ABN6X775_9MICO|nr:hypothetical protein [Microbacterium suwonense]BDZ40630.1 hypothetical protein GCM10025863_32440 [Microbacterium suwonense]